jgi:hypothetical protein
MSHIRIPIDAESFLPLVSKHRTNDSGRGHTHCFETYADLAVFLASYGFAIRRHQLPERTDEAFLQQPGPIDIGIFSKSDQRFPPLLLMALAATSDQKVVRDEDRICEIAELFAAAGSRALKAHIQKEGTTQHLAIAKILAKFSPEEEMKI